MTNTLTFLLHQHQKTRWWPQRPRDDHDGNCPIWITTTTMTMMWWTTGQQQLPRMNIEQPQRQWPLRWQGLARVIIYTHTSRVQLYVPKKCTHAHYHNTCLHMYYPQVCTCCSCAHSTLLLTMTSLTYDLFWNSHMSAARATMDTGQLQLQRVLHLVLATSTGTATISTTSSRVKVWMDRHDVGYLSSCSIVLKIKTEYSSHRCNRKHFLCPPASFSVCCLNIMW